MQQLSNILYPPSHSKDKNILHIHRILLNLSAITKQLQFLTQ